MLMNFLQMLLRLEIKSEQGESGLYSNACNSVFRQKPFSTKTHKEEDVPEALIVPLKFL